MILEPKNISIIGASGAIGSAFTKLLTNKYPNANIFAFSRKNKIFIDYNDEKSINQAAEIASSKGPIDLVIIANGILHDNDIMPEKSIKELSAKKFHQLFVVNTIIPALISKYFLPKLNKEYVSKFAILSARVGSISDNKLGGWYSYRASKAALNMIIKNFSIEISRSNPQAIIVGLHPGTVDSHLSKPFQSHVPGNKLFSPEQSGLKLIEVLENLQPNDSGKCFAWDGEEILP